MVIFEQTLRKILRGTNLVADRVFLMRAPQEPTVQPVPYFVFFPVGAVPRHAHTGPLDVIERLYQVSIFDNSQSRALAIADSLRGFLDTFHGPYDGYYISCQYAVQTWTWEQDTKLFQVIQEYGIMFRSLESANPQFQPAVPRR